MLTHLLFADVLLKPQAYLDPGSGSILIQGLLALLLAGGIFLKAFWKKIFPKKANKEEMDADDQDLTDDNPDSRN